MSTYDYALQEKKNPKLLTEYPERKRRRKPYSQQRKRRRRALIGSVMVLAGIFAVRRFRDLLDDGRTAGSHIQVNQSTHGPANTLNETDRLLMLVNKDHALPEGYEIQLYWLQNKSCAVSVEMYDALKEMLTDGSQDGREFVIASGYRDKDVQQMLLDEDIEASMKKEGLTYQQAYEKETRETMPPGYSEHETGLAVDIVSLNYQILDEQQEYMPENQWLRENCSRYGFILRYPKGKEEITGIDYEPWHFRYVGKAAAKEIMSRGITLEEYLGEA